MKYDLKNRAMNLPAWLLVFYSIVTGACTQLEFNIVFSISTRPELSCQHITPSIQSSSRLLTSTIQYFLLVTLFPLTGWLADTKIGREKTIHLSLWSCWLGTLLQVISYCIQYGTCGLPVNIAKYGISGISLLLLMFGTAGLFTNIPPLGLDQLYDKSNTHSRAFVHWMVWGLFVGYLTGYIAFVERSIYDGTLLLITGLIIFLVSSIALCLHSCLNYKFKPSIILKKNPYKMIYQVLKYAWQHKISENRSALTYWETVAPSRIDLGKQKYGGCFSESEVEDTKTFWRIVAFFLSTVGFFIVYYHTILGVLKYTDSLKGATSTLNGYGSYVLWSSFDEIIVIMIPLVELVIIPLFPKIEFFLLNPLKGLGAVYILMILSLISMLVIDIVGHFVSHYDVGCFLSVSSQHKQLDISYLYYTIPFLLSSLVDGLSYIFIFEFICSQAPVNMSGMLTGMFWFIRGVYINIGSLLFLPFFFSDINGPSKLSCSFWSLSIQFIICIIGLIVYGYVSRCYKLRQRESNYDASMRIVIENIFIEALDAEESANKSFTGYIHCS